MDRLDELAVFLAILDGGSLAAAGRHLRRSPPAVTRTLAALEARVGARLLERTTRRAAPTDAGRSLAIQARALLAAYAETVQDAGAKALGGVLRVTAPVVFGRRHVAAVVASFLRAHRGMQAELVLADRTLPLVDEGLDVAVRIGVLQEQALLARRVGAVGRWLVASPGYLAVHGTPGRPSDLAGHDVVFAATRPMAAEWRFRDGGRARIVRLAPYLVVNDIEAGLAALRAGAGIGSALSYQVADDVASGRLTRLLQPFEPPLLAVHLVCPGGRFLPPRTRAFLDHAAPELAANPALHP